MQQMAFKLKIGNLQKGIEKITEKPILTSFLVFLILTVVVLGLSRRYYIHNFDEFYLNVLAEAHGMLFDILVIGILIFWLNKSGETRLRIRTYKDEIDDFRMWESEEAAFRNVGNIKRLNRHHIYRMNLANCYLRKTNLNYVKLPESNLNTANLSGTTLIEANLKKARLNQANLENATINQACLEGAYASGANFKDAYLIKTNLKQALLIKANFENAFMMDADLNGAFLSGADFTNANLYRADLRNATGLTAEQFSNVKTIYKTKFDAAFELILAKQFPKLIEA